MDAVAVGEPIPSLEGAGAHARDFRLCAGSWGARFMWTRDRAWRENYASVWTYDPLSWSDT